ncbi:UcrQ family protein [Ostertagia ostertagi]
MSENYYYTRDGRREVKPPKPLYLSDGHHAQFGTHTGEVLAQLDGSSKLNQGPSANFGSPAPTPGFGYEWKRTREEELQTQKEDPELSRLELSMSKHFGALGKMYGEYRFALAPNEQKAFKGFLDQAVVKVFKNYVWYEWPYYLPQCIGAYLLYDWAKKKNYQVGRKNPADYANDQ